MEHRRPQMSSMGLKCASNVHNGPLNDAEWLLGAPPCHKYPYGVKNPKEAEEMHQEIIVQMKNVNSSVRRIVISDAIEFYKTENDLIIGFQKIYQPPPLHLWCIDTDFRMSSI